jgi:hypothetical protein
VIETFESRIAKRFEPPESATFFEEFWMRAEQAERTAARRWRATAVVAICAAVAATSAAGVLAFGGGATKHTVDGTFVCTSNDQGGVNIFEVGLTAQKPFGFVGVFTTPNDIIAPNKLPQQAGYRATRSQLDDGKLHFDPNSCASTSKRIALGRQALPLKGRVTGTVKLECWVTKAYFRERVTFDSQNRAIRTTFAMQNAKTGKPLVYAEAAPTQLTVYAAGPCLHA